VTFAAGAGRGVFRKGAIDMQSKQTLGVQGGDHAALNRQLEDIGWGLFLMVIGGLLLVPGEQLPQGAWLMLAGVIMLSLNLVRYLNGIRANVFTTAFGALALAAGLGSLFGVELPLFAIFLLLVGAALVFRPLFGKGR
jgi:hypothetical protein